MGSFLSSVQNRQFPRRDAKTLQGEVRADANAPDLGESTTPTSPCHTQPSGAGAPRPPFERPYAGAAFAASGLDNGAWIERLLWGDETQAAASLRLIDPP
jgi:hypothetical protein